MSTYNFSLSLAQAKKKALKKKRHTRTHLTAVAPDRQILVFSTAYPGKAHDKGILNTEGWAERREAAFEKSAEHYFTISLCKGEKVNARFNFAKSSYW